MKEYKETQITGKVWQRAFRIVIENPLGEIPEVNFVEEIVTPGLDGYNHKMVGCLSYKFDNPDEMIAMIDPATNELTDQSFPVSLAQWIIYSLYWQLAAKRDTPPEPTKES